MFRPLFQSTKMCQAKDSNLKESAAQTDSVFSKQIRCFQNIFVVLKTDSLLSK